MYNHKGKPMTFKISLLIFKDIFPPAFCSLQTLPLELWIYEGHIP